MQIESFDGVFPRNCERTWILISCDDKYFQEHAPSFIYSAAKNNHSVHVNVINPSSRSYSNYLKMREDLEGTAQLTFTQLMCDIDPNQNWDELRAFYASSRFIIASAVMAYNSLSSLYISDTDSVVLNNLITPAMNEGWKRNIGLFLRPNEPDEMKVAAGIVYLEGKVGHEYIFEVGKILQSNKPFWFIDQVVLYQVSRDPKFSPYVTPLDHSIMDWEFQSKDVGIWTGKGDRKYNNQTYIEYKNQENKLPNMKERFWL